MLQEVALWAEVLGGLAVIGGIIFGIAQLRLIQRQRADRAAIEVVRSMLSEHFPSSYRLLNYLPDGVTVEEIRRKGPEYEEAVFRIATVFESLGYMVFRGVVPLAVVRELVGGVALAMWRKLETWKEEVVEMEGQDRVVEWYEWLVNRLRELDDREPAARATVRFNTWKRPQ
jgi:hypothetical protein